jgi:hypothetical protein
VSELRRGRLELRFGGSEIACGKQCDTTLSNWVTSSYERGRQATDSIFNPFLLANSGDANAVRFVVDLTQPNVSEPSDWQNAEPIRAPGSADKTGAQPAMARELL